MRQRGEAMAQEMVAARPRPWWKRLWGFFTQPPEELPVDQALERAIKHPDELFQHLNVLRRHVLRAVVVFFVVAFGSLTFMPQILNFLAQPVGGLENLRAIDVTEPVGVTMRVAVLTAFVVTLPYLYLEMYLFVAPGLYPRGRILGLLLMPLVYGLFLAGMFFAYKVFLPVALPFLLNFMGIPTLPRPSSYIRFVVSLLFWTGLAFEYPLVIYVLARMRLVQARSLWQYWRIAMVVIAVLAALITPTVDPVNMLVVMGPLVVLYFVGAALASLAQQGNASPQK